MYENQDQPGHLQGLPGENPVPLVPSILPPNLAKAAIPSILVSGKQVVSQSVASVPGAQVVEEEAKRTETNLEKVCEENPLVLKGVWKVKSDAA